MSFPDRAHRATALPAPVPGAPPAPRVPVPARFELDNGLHVVAVPTGGLPQVVLRLVVPAGSATDPDGLPGAASLLGQLLPEGTELRNADDLNDRLDRLGASLEVHVGHDFAEIELFLLSETLAEAVPLLAEVVTRPVFPPREVERLRREALDGLAARYDEPANVADDRVAEAVFGANHPYGRPSMGSAAGIRALSRGRLLEQHQRLYRPRGSLLVAAGDLRPSELGELLHEVFGGWSGTPALEPRLPVPDRPAEPEPRVHVPWPDAQQAEIRVGGRGMERSCPDWIPAALANFVLGGSTITGRLGANLREEKGWTYGARSAFSAALQPGGWVVDTAVEVGMREPALAEVQREIHAMVEELATEEELARAQQALVLSLPRAFETPGRVASRFVTLAAYGLAQDYWERFPEAVARVTREEVRKIARRYFDPDRLVSVVVA